MKQKRIKRYLQEGQRFGRLSVIREVEKLKGNFVSYRRYLCKCDCGNEKIVLLSHLIRGSISSCRCLQKEVVGRTNTTHGKRKSREYSTYRSMLARCYSKKYKKYNDYGGRGITVCDRWLQGFENFYEDMGDRPDGKTLDRIDNNGNYCKENCRWSDGHTQRINQRRTKFISYDSKDMVLKDWCKLYGKDYRYTHLKMKKKGYSFEKAMGFE